MTSSTPAPPLAKRVPHVHEAHGDRRPDDYHWLRDRDDPDVEAYLEAENAYADAVLEPLRALQDKLYDEIVSRIQETDLSVPVPHGPWLYYSRSVEGLQYPIHCRRSAGEGGTGEGGPEQILIDENLLAEGHDYCALGAFEVSPDHRLLAWSLDTEGDEDHVLRIRDLETGEDFPEAIPGTSYGTAWASDNRTVFYTTLDESRRPWRVWRHRLGADPADDVIVHQEDDDRFFCNVERTRSGGFIIIDLRSAVTSETLTLPADDPEGTFTVLVERRQGVEYGVDHHGDRFFILSNEGAPNFRLVEAAVADPSPAQWQEILPHSPDIKLEGLATFARHLVVLERAEAVRRLRVLALEGESIARRNGSAGGAAHLIEQPEPVCRVGMPDEDNPEFDRGTVRYTYTSLVTPQSIFDYDLDTRERTLLKQEPVLGGYNPDEYETRRLWASAADGTRVPISLVARKGVALDGSAPCVLYGYGSYEASSDPRFSSLRLSLLDRGFVWAIGHIRGGGEMGRAWYEAGKLAHKMNTFTDFIACAEHLVKEGWTSPNRLTILGGSAGGLLVGAALNLRPDLFRAAVAEVPFVDVVSTISDPTLPLSVIEWEEWGNPAEPEFYETIKAYSPYDNVRAVRYPDLFVTAGLNDPRVSYWEPAKWVAKLRVTADPQTKIVLRTEMGAGHGGPSGRYDAWRKEAEIFAFLLEAVGLTE